MYNCKAHNWSHLINSCPDCFEYSTSASADAGEMKTCIVHGDEVTFKTRLITEYVSLEDHDLTVRKLWKEIEVTRAQRNAALLSIGGWSLVAQHDEEITKAVEGVK